MAEFATEIMIIQLCASYFTGIQSAIEITQGPRDVTVLEGESASFPCFYTGTNDIPLWHIGGATYSVQALGQGLPERHSYTNRTMTISDVQVSDNQTTYRCSFLFGEITSNTATLTAIAIPQENVSSSTTQLDRLTMVSPIVTTSTPVMAVTVTASSSLTTVTVSRTDDNTMQSLHPGILAGVAIVSTLIITVFIMAIWFIIRRYASAPKPSCEVPTYEDIPDEIPNTVELEVQRNACYVQGRVQEPEYAEVEMIIKTQSNDAYCSSVRIARS